MTEFWDHAFKDKQEMWGLEPAKSTTLTKNFFVEQKIKIQNKLARMAEIEQTHPIALDKSDLLAFLVGRVGSLLCHVNPKPPDLSG
ncbi:MAG: hypothetical protein JJU34_03020 [Lunatimonas sp.]|uniref:hypothetical protein n=1 Tax=Lunatimonas sp. TaxID=2060141 RepID=UPI00263A4BFF|nr:hypothetical protein [Lunatimonas sp.]MCC5936233.1 hypothetical protein [Lunatimonas sp.]